MACFKICKLSCTSLTQRGEFTQTSCYATARYVTQGYLSVIKGKFTHRAQYTYAIEHDVPRGYLTYGGVLQMGASSCIPPGMQQREMSRKVTFHIGASCILGRVLTYLQLPCGTEFFAILIFAGFFSRSAKISSHKIKLP